MSELSIGETFRGQDGSTVPLRRVRRSDWRDLANSAVSIQQVPLPLPGRERAAWRVAALALCLAACRGQSATVEQLHVLTWAIRDSENARRFLAVWTGVPGIPASLRAWDSSLDDTLRLAQAADLVQVQPNGRQKLTTMGKSVVAAIRASDDGLMVEEQQLLASLGQITESGMWRRLGTPPRVPNATSAEAGV